MAAVLALIMVPLFLAIGFFSNVTRAEGTFVSAFAMATFFALGAGMLLGAVRFVRTAEDTVDEH